MIIYSFKLELLYFRLHMKMEGDIKMETEEEDTQHIDIHSIKEETDKTKVMIKEENPLEDNNDKEQNGEANDYHLIA